MYVTRDSFNAVLVNAKDTDSPIDAPLMYFNKTYCKWFGSLLYDKTFDDVGQDVGLDHGFRKALV